MHGHVWHGHVHLVSTCAPYPTVEPNHPLAPGIGTGVIVGVGVAIQALYSGVLMHITGCDKHHHN